MMRASGTFELRRDARCRPSVESTCFSVSEAARVRTRKEREPAELPRQALEDRGGQTSLEPSTKGLDGWIDRYRMEFCLTAAQDFSLASLEQVAS
jgi:hypothetical protein